MPTKRPSILFLIAVFCFVPCAFAAPPTAGTIDRSQELIQGDKILTQQVEKEKQYFIDKIDIKGASKLSSKEVEKIVAPFQGSWLSKKDFQKIIDSLKAAYVKKRFDTGHLKITYEIKKSGTLTVILAPDGNKH